MLLGANLPWLNYGHDFGAAWGHQGVSTQGASETLREVLSELASTGAHVVEPLDPLGGVSVADAKRRIGGRVALMGGVNTLTLSRATPEEVRAEAGELYDDDFSQDFDYSASGGAFSKGQAVSHAKFGRGKVKEFHDLGENSIVVVSFNTGQTKPLMLKYANLTKI